MSATNGDRARFHKNRKRKLLHRTRIQALVNEVRENSTYTVNTAGAEPPARANTTPAGPGGAATERVATVRD